MRNIGLIGTGVLSKAFVEGYHEHLTDSYKLLGVLGSSPKKSKDFADQNGIKGYESIEKMIDDDVDIVVEFAGVPAVAAYAEKILKAGIDLIPVSTGAFANDELLNRCKEILKGKKNKMYMPAGAIGGLDFMRALTLMGGLEMDFYTVKNPKSFNKQAGEEIKEVITIFEGTAREAIAEFPKNTNVTITAALASVGIDQVKVKIALDPEVSTNQHTISLKSPSSEVIITTKSIPSPDNPASSTLAAWSVVGLLDNLRNDIRFF